MTKTEISNSGKSKAATPKAKLRAKPQPNPINQPKRKSRQDQLKSLLSRKSGATAEKIQTAFGWQSHSVRAAVSGLRKAGENIEKVQTASGTAYRIVSAGAAK